MYQPYNFPYRPQYQPIQTIQQQAPQAQCFFVNSKDDMQTIQPEPNISYIGINRKAKEVYIRAWNNNGVIDFDTYSLTDGKKENTELKTIMDKLETIENKLREKDNERNDTNAHATSNVGDAPKPSGDATL